MDATVLSSIIGGGSSLLGSIGTTWFNANQAKKQRDWNEAMMAKQNAWNEEMWAKTNEYNSPANQVARLREAGLNPLYYGLDGSSANAMESAQPLGYERANMSSIDNPINAGLSAAAQIAQISNVQANTAKTNNENLTETQRRENMQAEYLVIKQELQNKLAEEGLADAQKRNIEKAIEWTDRINTAIIAEKESESKLNDAQRNRIDKLLKGELDIQTKTIEDFEHKWEKIDAEISKMAAEEKLLYEDLANYALNHMSSGLMGTGFSLQNALRMLFEGKKGNPVPEKSGVR